MIFSKRVSANKLPIVFKEKSTNMVQSATRIFTGWLLKVMTFERINTMTSITQFMAIETVSNETISA